MLQHLFYFNVVKKINFKITQHYRFYNKLLIKILSVLKN